MAGLIREDDLEQIKDRADIIDIISEQVILKKAGRTYKGLCPFHQEKTPSFSVDPSKQLWHCFGCGEGGDIISFVMKTEGLDFTEAVESLARRVGYTVHYSQSNSKNIGVKQKIFAANAAAAGYFSKMLFSAAGQGARDYLKSRGFNKEIAETMWLGFAPDSWDDLKDYLLNQNFNEVDILKAGLVSRSASGKVFDRFRGRLIFPIKDIQGRVVAFGARTLSGGSPKYLNSAETPVYRKGSVLYGLNQAKTAISSQAAAIIVEGYTDLLALKMAGFDNTVATCGTAFTLAHFKLISRFTDDIIFVFDGDSAGVAAAERGLELVSQIRLPGDNSLKKLLNSHKIGVKVLVLPEELDPAEYLAKNDPESFRLLISQAKPFTDFYLERIMKKYELNDINQRHKAVAEALAFIKLLSSAVAQEEYLKRTAEIANVSLETLQIDFKRAGGDRYTKTSKVSKPEPPKKILRNASSIAEREMLKLILQNSGENAFLKELEPTDWQNQDNKQLFTVLKSKLEGKGKLNVQNIVHELEDSQKNLVVSLMMEPILAEDKERYFLSIYFKIKELSLARRIKALISELTTADTEKQKDLEKNILKLQNQRREMRDQVV